MYITTLRCKWVNDKFPIYMSHHFFFFFFFFFFLTENIDQVASAKVLEEYGKILSDWCVFFYSMKSILNDERSTQVEPTMDFMRNIFYALHSIPEKIWTGTGFSEHWNAAGKRISTSTFLLNDNHMPATFLLTASCCYQMREQFSDLSISVNHKIYLFFDKFHLVKKQLASSKKCSYFAFPFGSPAWPHFSWWRRSYMKSTAWSWWKR